MAYEPLNQKIIPEILTAAKRTGIQGPSYIGRMRHIAPLHHKKTQNSTKANQDMSCPKALGLLHQRGLPDDVPHDE